MRRLSSLCSRDPSPRTTPGLLFFPGSSGFAAHTSHPRIFALRSLVSWRRPARMPRQGQGAGRTAQRNGGFPAAYVTRATAYPGRGAEPRGGLATTLGRVRSLSSRATAACTLARGAPGGAATAPRVRSRRPLRNPPPPESWREPLTAEGRVRDVMLAERLEAGRAVQRARFLAAGRPARGFRPVVPRLPDFAHANLCPRAGERCSLGALEGKCRSAGACVRL